MLEGGKGKVQFSPGWSDIQKVNVILASQKLQHCFCCFPFSQSKPGGIFTWSSFPYFSFGQKYYFFPFPVSIRVFISQISALKSDSNTQIFTNFHIAVKRPIISMKKCATQNMNTFASISCKSPQVIPPSVGIKLVCLCLFLNLLQTFL